MEKLNKIPQILKLLPIAVLLITTLFYSTSLMRSASLYFIVNILMIVVAAEAGLLSFLKPPSQTNLKSIILKPISVFSPDYYNEETDDDTHQEKTFAALKDSPAPHDEQYTEEKSAVRRLDNAAFAGKSLFLSEKILGAVKVENVKKLITPLVLLPASIVKVENVKKLISPLVLLPASIVKVENVKKLITPLVQLPVSIVKAENVKKLITPLLPASIFFIGGGDKEDHPLVEDDSEDEYDDEDEDQNGEESGELFRKAEAFIGDFYKQLKMQRENR